MASAQAQPARGVTRSFEGSSLISRLTTPIDATSQTRCAATLASYLKHDPAREQPKSPLLPPKPMPPLFNFEKGFAHSPALTDAHSKIYTLQPSCITPLNNSQNAPALSK